MKSVRSQFDAIGTRWTIECVLPEDVVEEALSQVRNRIDLYDQNYSRFRSDSFIHLISKKAGSYKMPADWDPLWRVYEKLYNLTEGAFTPLIGELLEDFGYDAHYSLKAKEEPREIPTLANIVKYENGLLDISKPALLDIGAGGKGYLIDIVTELLTIYGAECIVIEAGGDIVNYSATSLRVGLENPFNTTQVVGIIEIGNESICASSGNRRRLGAEHHILNPYTARSPKLIAATWVIAESGLLADALSTAIFLTSPYQLLKHFEFEWAILGTDSSARYSQRFHDAFFM